MWGKIEKWNRESGRVVEMGLCYVSIKEPNFLYSQSGFDDDWKSQTDSYAV